MKYFIAIALLAAVASAAVIKPTQLTGDLSEIEQIVAAINSPSTDPATATALEAMLLDYLGVAQPEPAIVDEISPISVGPAIVDTSPISVGPAIIESSPISVGPAMIDFALPDGGVVTADESEVVIPAPVVAPTPVQPSPVVVGEIPSGSSPLVQIIVNVNQAESSVVAPAPAVTPEVVVDEVYQPGPVNVVESADVELVAVAPVVVEQVETGPVNVVESADVVPVAPVQVVEPVVIQPIAVGTPVLPTPVVVEPVLVATPIIPAPAVVLPDELN